MDKSGMVRQLEALVDNLKHDKEIMREEQMNYETTTEEVFLIHVIFSIEPVISPWITFDR